MNTPVLWHDLRRFTPARVALGRVGNGLPTREHLAFQAAHAAARDAVHTELDVPALRGELAAAGLASLVVRSACPDRRTYLLRPDLGRRLHDEDRARIAAKAEGVDVAVVICDGLSALAVQRHAAPLTTLIMPALAKAGLATAIVIATQGRVALGDDAAAALGARSVLVLIGERPGLSTPDSLGAYLTWAPYVGRSDAERNCVSNIRAEGLQVPAAAEKLLWLMGEMRRLGLSGVGLKDEQGAALLA